MTPDELFDLLTRAAKGDDLDALYQEGLDALQICDCF